MWRWMVLALVVANGGFWLWHHGELRALGLGPIEVAEPARLKTQIQPEALRITPQEPAPAAATTANTPDAAAAPASAPSPALAPAPALLQPPAPAGAAPATPAPSTAKGK